MHNLLYARFSGQETEIRNQFLNDIKNKFDEGGSILGLDVPKEVEIAASFVPIL